jgi:hypothetical protein
MLLAGTPDAAVVQQHLMSMTACRMNRAISFECTSRGGGSAGTPPDHYHNTQIPDE